MTYQSILDQIKTEARIKQDSSFDTLVISLINELFKEATESQRPFELRQEVSITPLTLNATVVTLPIDFFLQHQILYTDAVSGKQYDLIDQDDAISPAPLGLYGKPKSFEISTGGVLRLKPFGNIAVNDSVLLVYYKTPPTITVATLIDENPIPRLEPYIIRGCVRRIRMYHSDDIQVAQMLQMDMQSAAAGYAKDEPEPETSHRK